jgi:dephospho-CoA kinase
MSKPAFAFGLTGGVACGKTTVASFFVDLGAKVIDADAIAHDLLRRASGVYSQIVHRFGSEILEVSGEIDRKRLGAIVFANRDKRRELESILHPRIVRKHDQMAQEYYRENPRAVILVEAALIYEAHVENHFRKILVAWCRPEQQIERLVAKARISKPEAEVRIATQMPGEDKRRRADFVIDCSRSVEDTRRQVEILFPQLRDMVIREPARLSLKAR